MSRSPRYGLMRRRFFTGADCSCPGLVAGGGATGSGKPRKIMTRNIGSNR